MSARPRPVTATFKPASMKVHTIVPRTKRLSLGSDSSSTESLTSILHHESYESPSDSDDDLSKQRDKNRNNNAEENDESSINCTFITETSITDTSQTSSAKTIEEKLSNWESWLIRKSQEDRQNKRKELQKQRKLREEKEKQEKEKIEKLKKSEQVTNEWIERRATELKVQKKLQSQKKKSEQEIKSQERLKTVEKADKEYHEWLEMKQEQQRKKIELEKRHKQVEEEKKLEKQRQSEAAFEDWCKKAQTRPKAVYNSFGYTSGKLTGNKDMGYHDGNAYPVPSFYNPVPWQPIHVPNPQRDKKKKTTKPYKFNPKKYF